jgi:hypothetical protein
MSTSTLTRLAAAGNALEKRFKEELADQRSDEFKAVIAELHQWLRDCVEQGRYLHPGAADRRSLQGQLDYWTSRLLQLGQGFEDVDRIAEFDRNAGHVLPADRFPYHGLLAATADGGKLFCGREEQTLEYADHFDATSGPQRNALLIQSESGGGKSSVAMAGVVPELLRRHPEWLVLPRVTPGMLPADTLRQALQALLHLDMVDVASVQASLAGRTLLIYVDQLEELLTMCHDVRQQEDFCKLLATLADSGAVRLLATMRIDHYGRLAHSAACHPLYALLTRDGSVKTLLPMSLAQIRQVIQKPADAVDLRFVPPSIVETLAAETANAPGGLPLLQFALQRLWDERPREGGRADGAPLDMIRDDTMLQLPTLRTALGTVAEHYYKELAERGLAEAGRRLMLELTVIDETLEVPLRRRRVEAEVCEVLTSAGLADASTAPALIDGLVQRRLLVRTGHGKARQIEVAHEALFRHWDRFQDWLDSDDSRATLREARQITRDALLWEQSGHSAELLNLRGERLDKALRLQRDRWLELGPSAYVTACTTAADASASEMKWRRLRSRVGGLVAVSALTAAAFLGWGKAQSDQASVANTSSAAMMLSQLRPIEALDLAYTLRQLKTPESLATLVQAMDDLGEVALVGNRDDQSAYFTTSGQAAFQFVSSKDQAQVHARVRVLGPQLEQLEPALSVPLNGQGTGPAAEEFALFDVGPRFTDGTAAGRLAVVGFIDAAGPADHTRSLKRLRVYRLDADKHSARLVDELPYPPDTRTTSEIAFERSGRQLAWVLRPWGNAAPTTVVTWTLGGKPVQAGADAVGNGAAVTAVAFAADGSGQLILGRQDGSISCGAGKLLEAGDWTKVVALRTTAGSSRVVALHDNNSISIGDCAGDRAYKLKGPGLDTPETLALRVASGSAAKGAVDISYALSGQLNCQRVVTLEAAADPNPCEGQGLAANMALPVTDPQGALQGYRLIETVDPWIKFLRLGSTAKDSRASAVNGLPVAGVPQEQGQSSTAASPSGGHEISIIAEADSFRVVRSQVASPSATPAASAAAPTPVAAKSPLFVTVRNDGLALVLASRTAEKPHLLSAVAPDGQVRASAPTFSDAVCMKPSPDGQQVVVANDGGAAKLLAVRADGISGAGEMPRGGDLGLDKVTACAVGNGPRAKVVLATLTGAVRQYDAVAARWRSVSELVPFSLGAPALDVAVDASSRFVAVIGARSPGHCRSSPDGHQLRIWDLQLERPEYPVASTCITRDLRKLGPIERKPDGSWVLPIYYEAPESGSGRPVLMRMSYPCRSCADDPTANDAGARVDQEAAAIGATQLQREVVRARYGIRF